MEIILGVIAGLAVIFGKDLLKIVFEIMNKKELNDAEVTIAKNEGKISEIENNVNKLKEETNKEIEKDVSNKEISDFFNDRSSK